MPAAAPAAVFTSTWLGSITVGMGEYIIKRIPLVQHIYSAAKQASPIPMQCMPLAVLGDSAAGAVTLHCMPLCPRALCPARRPPIPRPLHPLLQVSAAVSPDKEAANSFRECVIIRHPRRDGEFAFAFITGQTVLQVRKLLFQTSGASPQHAQRL